MGNGRTALTDFFENTEFSLMGRCFDVDRKDHVAKARQQTGLTSDDLPLPLGP